MHNLALNCDEAQVDKMSLLTMCLDCIFIFICQTLH